MGTFFSSVRSGLEKKSMVELTDMVRNNENGEKGGHACRGTITDLWITVSLVRGCIFVQSFLAGLITSSQPLL